MMCCEKLSSDKLHDSFENLSLPSDNSGDFSEVEDEFANKPQNGLKIPQFTKQ